MAEKIARYHYILRPENTNELRIGGITDAPGDPFPQPRLDFCPIAVPIKHLLLVISSQTVKDRCANQLGGVGAISGILSEVENFL